MTCSNGLVTRDLVLSAIIENGRKRKMFQGKRQFNGKLRLPVHLYRLESVKFGLSLQEILHKGSGGLTCLEFGIADNGLLEGNRCLDPSNYIFVQSPIHALNRNFARASISDQLTDHAIVVGRDDVAPVSVGI